MGGGGHPGEHHDRGRLNKGSDRGWQGRSLQGGGEQRHFTCQTSEKSRKLDCSVSFVFSCEWQACASHTNISSVFHSFWHYSRLPPLLGLAGLCTASLYRWVSMPRDTLKLISDLLSCLILFIILLEQFLWHGRITRVSFSGRQGLFIFLTRF